jgi:hypothetical protein
MAFKKSLGDFREKNYHCGDAGGMRCKAPRALCGGPHKRGATPLRARQRPAMGSFFMEIALCPFAALIGQRAC